MPSLFAPAVRGGLVAVAAAALLAAPLHAQTQAQPQPPTQELPDSIQELVDEFREKQARLQEVQQRALQGSEELQTEQGSIQESVQTAMGEIDPQFEERVQRLGEIRTEAAEAQAAEDEEALSALVNEARQLQTTLSRTRDEALQREEIQAEIAEFQQLLLAEMIRLDPEVETVMERLEELAERLRG